MSRVTAATEATERIALVERWRLQVDDYVIALRPSPDGQMLAVAESQGGIHIVETRSGRVTHRLAGHRSGTNDLAWSPDSTRVASAGQDGTVRLWCAIDGSALQVFDCGAQWVERVSWSPPARRDRSALAAAAGRSLLLWNDRGEPIGTWHEHDGSIADLTWQPNGNDIAACGYGGVTIRGSRVGKPPRRLRYGGSCLTLAWSPDGRILASGNQDDAVHLWYVASGKELHMSGYACKVQNLSWDASSRLLASGGGQSVAVWNCGRKGPAGTKPIMLDGHNGAVSALAFQHGGDVLASGAYDSAVALWQPRKSCSPIAAVSMSDRISQLRWQPDDQGLYAADAQGVVIAANLNRYPSPLF
jgi:WD40 repeat protein